MHHKDRWPKLIEVITKVNDKRKKNWNCYSNTSPVLMSLNYIIPLRSNKFHKGDKNPVTKATLTTFSRQNTT